MGNRYVVTVQMIQQLQFEGIILKGFDVILAVEINPENESTALQVNQVMVIKASPYQLAKDRLSERVMSINNFGDFFGAQQFLQSNIPPEQEKTNDQF